MPALLRDLFDHSARGLPFDVTTVEDDEDLAEAVTRLEPDYVVVGLEDGWPDRRALIAFEARPAVRVLGVSQRNGIVYVYSLDRGELGELDGPLLAKEMLSRAG
jgi:hypothetical protein